MLGGKMTVVNTKGMRKTAVAHATIKSGTGEVLVNNKPIEKISPELLRLKIMEPLYLSGCLWKKINISMGVRGGGISGQADAARQAIARGLLEWFKDDELTKKIIEYDRTLLSYDPRRVEPRKPSRSSKGARRRKQMSKR